MVHGILIILARVRSAALSGKTVPTRSAPVA
jgi:hypothetical protein